MLVSYNTKETICVSKTILSRLQLMHIQLYTLIFQTQQESMSVANGLQ